jgi:hypothetical protein
MLHCGDMPRFAPRSDWRDAVDRELPWLALTMGALGLALAFEHWVVHRGVVLPAIDADGFAPPWVWGALFVPELVVLFATGWRLRSWTLVALHAGLAAGVRELFHVLLLVLREPGHTSTVTVSEFALKAPVVALAYLLVLGLASASGREEATFTSQVPRAQRGR